MSKFKFSVGPWNVHEGADAYGPATRETIPFEENLANGSLTRESQIVTEAVKQFYFRLNLPQTGV